MKKFKSEDVWNKYLELNKNLTKTSKYYNVHFKTIKKYLLSNGYKPKGMLKYHFNKSFFKQYNEKSIYWAGFLAADGCVQIIASNTKRLHLQLSTIDRKHIEKFINDIKFDGNIFDRNHKGSKLSYINITICNDVLKDLSKYNIIYQKTFKYKFPNHLIKSNLVRHFIRGYIDGDGCWTIDKRRKHGLNCEILGTKSFLEDCKTILENNLNLNSNTSIKKHSSIYRLRYSGENANKIARWLYNNSTVYLDRKLEKVTPYI